MYAHVHLEMCPFLPTFAVQLDCCHSCHDCHCHAAHKVLCGEQLPGSSDQGCKCFSRTVAGCPGRQQCRKMQPKGLLEKKWRHKSTTTITIFRFSVFVFIHIGWMIWSFGGGEMQKDHVQFMRQMICGVFLWTVCSRIRSKTLPSPSTWIRWTRTC